MERLRQSTEAIFPWNELVLGGEGRLPPPKLAEEVAEPRALAPPFLVKNGKY
jgi:hypothetical protein